MRALGVVDAQLVRELVCHMAAVAKHDHWSLARPEAKVGDG